MIFKTDVFVVKKEGKTFPVGTPKVIKDLKLGDELYFELEAWGTSNKADNVTIYNVTKDERHTLKKGKMFSALNDVQLALK